MIRFHRRLNAVLLIIIVVISILFIVGPSKLFEYILLEHKTINTGSILTLNIGDSKITVLDKLRTYKVNAIRSNDETAVRDGRTQWVYLTELRDEDTKNQWLLKYNNWFFPIYNNTPHGEMYELFFVNDKLERVEYRRKRFQLP